MINKEQCLLNDDQRKEIYSVPQRKEIYSVPDEIETSRSTWAEQIRREAVISDNCQEGFTRSRKLTIQGLLHKKKTLREIEVEKQITD